MKFTSAVLAAALALTSGVFATNTTDPTNSGASYSYTTSTTTVDNGVQALIFNVATKHSSFTIAKFVAAATSKPYSYAYTNNLTTAIAKTDVASANSANPVFIVSPSTAAVCNSNVTVGTNYQWSPDPVVYAPTGYSGSGETVTVTLTGHSDATIALANDTAGALSLAAVDAAGGVGGFQQGKFYYFNVPANATTGAGNVVSATIALGGSTNPFKSLNVVGGGKCPIPNATDSVVRKSQDLSALTALSSSTAFAVANITTGSDFWIYLEPKATVVAGTANNTLGASDKITLTYSLTNGTTCTAGTNGFCSGAATIKSAVGVAFAGVMAAAFLLF